MNTTGYMNFTHERGFDLIAGGGQYYPNGIMVRGCDVYCAHKAGAPFGLARACSIPAELVCLAPISIPD